VGSPPPTVGGVSPSRLRLPPGRWATVLEFLTERFPGVGAETWLARMSEGRVTDEAGRRVSARTPYRAGACVFYYRELEAEAPIPFAERVVYRDEHILVADKPHFLPVVPAGRFLRETLLVRLKQQGAPAGLVPAHRLDRETAGVVLFSLNPATRGLYAALFRERKVAKLYEALAPTRPDLRFPLTRRSRLAAGEPFFRMKEVEGEPNAETRVDVLRRRGAFTLYELRPLTGRKHQLRLHLSALGMPIMNDRLYPEPRDAGEDDFSRPLQLLARSLAFRDPLTGREHHFESDRELRGDDVD